MGRKNKPHYRIVAANARAPRDGKFLEKLGSYRPFQDGKATKDLRLNFKRTRYWLGVGAQPSKTVHKLLALADIIPNRPQCYSVDIPRRSAGEEADGE